MTWKLDSLDHAQEIIADLEKKNQKMTFALNRLRKGGEFCKTCNGSGYRMNRNGYAEDCLNCNGIGVQL